MAARARRSSINSGALQAAGIALGTYDQHRERGQDDLSAAVDRTGRRRDHRGEFFRADHPAHWRFLAASGERVAVGRRGADATTRGFAEPFAELPMQLERRDSRVPAPAFAAGQARDVHRLRERRAADHCHESQSLLAVAPVPQLRNSQTSRTKGSCMHWPFRRTTPTRARSRSRISSHRSRWTPRSRAGMDLLPARRDAIAAGSQATSTQTADLPLFDSMALIVHTWIDPDPEPDRTDFSGYD